MARIAFPYLKIFRTRNSLLASSRTLLIQPSNESRAYKRVDGKFIPIGWYVEWSDGKKEVILDTNL